MALLRDPALTIPERHLGLVPTDEQAPDLYFFDRLADAAERNLALDRIWRIAEAPALAIPQDTICSVSSASGNQVTIAIARDRAFPSITRMASICSRRPAV